jgi:response regulator RpfG family c-di-GMP phosphodiesterase
VETDRSSVAAAGDPFADARILVVDDEPANIELLRAVLEGAGDVEVTGITDSSRAVELVAAAEPHIVLLDLHMPPPMGLEVLTQLRERFADGGPPVLMLTADTTLDMRRRALGLGARDFVTKPFDVLEIELRVRNLLQARRYELSLASRADELEAAVRSRTDELEDARLEALERLALAAEYRDDHTGDHTRRVARTARLLGSSLGLSARELDLLELAAPLHDVGKIAVPDSVLLKPGRLTASELSVVRSHVTVGARILGGSDSPLLRLAERIALRHHERWDGGGYPDGVAGEEIPPAARIVAVADVFDALLCARPYKPAWPLERAVAEVVAGAGTQFCPATAEAFEQLDHAELVPGAE